MESGRMLAKCSLNYNKNPGLKKPAPLIVEGARFYWGRRAVINYQFIGDTRMLSSLGTL